jgi:hypothetical protein
MTAILPVSQNKRRVFYRNAMYAAIGLLVAFAIGSRLFGFTMHAPAMLVLAAIGVLSLLQFNTLDEMAKQAHYIAWYWGGLIGLSAVALITFVIGVTPESFSLIESVMTQRAGGADAQSAFLLGLVTTPALMMLGFTGWWAAYWLRRR